MFRRLVVVGTLAAVFISPLAVSALTADEVQQQIKNLLEIIANLQKQLTLLQQGVIGSSQATTPSPLCRVWFDGCNTCTRDSEGGVLSCTEMACFQNTGAYCKEFFNDDSMPRICKRLQGGLGSLAQGSRGDQVTALQEFLRLEGFLRSLATGYFGTATLDALQRWQARERLANNVSKAGWGMFGPRSRARLLERCNNWNEYRFTAEPQRGSAPLSVNFSAWVGGFTIYRYAVDFGDGSGEEPIACSAPADTCVSPGVVGHTYHSDGNYTAILYRINTTTGAEDRTALARVKVSVGNQSVACTKEYRPVCGSKPIVCITTPCNPIQQTYSNRCMMEADGATFVHEGQCRSGGVDPANDPQCKRWNDGRWCGARCHRDTPGGEPMCAIPMCVLALGEVATPDRAPYCEEYFGTTGNRPPVISGFSGPTMLAVNETGFWIVDATDPENGVLSYRIRWGDEVSSGVYTAESAMSASFTQSSGFSHSYSYAGTYTITVVVRDAGGKEAKTTQTVHVGSGAVACTLEYQPVCGRPPGCAPCPAGMYCAMVCQQSEPVTYGNRCQMNAANATLLYEGRCDTGGTICPADAKQCSDGSWVGRSGPNCEFKCTSSGGASCSVFGSNEKYAHGERYYFRCPGLTACIKDPGWRVCSNGQWTIDTSDDD